MTCVTIRGIADCCARITRNTVDQTMALRTLADAEGRQWQIWDVHPTCARRTSTDELGNDEPKVARSSVTLPITLQSGWLAFQCDGDSRRLAPIPPDWESMSDRMLVALITSAKPSRSRAG